MTTSVRAATFADRRCIFEWMAMSDATAEMMGPPKYPDFPVPSYEEFLADYDDEAFSASGDFRIFVIQSDGVGIGAISYWRNGNAAEIDLWIGGKEHWGHGHGPKAMEEIAGILSEIGGIDALIIRPSARNVRAIAAYRKAGFLPYDAKRGGLPAWCTETGFDYEDAVVLVRYLCEASCAPPIDPH
ncbi:MAG: GNAT family protein [Albidovulum sp.]|nr:GNAT family protein [Albidovulum sp.]